MNLNGQLTSLENSWENQMLQHAWLQKPMMQLSKFKHMVQSEFQEQFQILVQTHIVLLIQALQVGGQHH